MSVRLVLTDSGWQAIESVIQQNKSQRGRPGQGDRQFVEAILYVARTGIPWRDLPADFGQWQAVYKRFRRWEANGLWEKVWTQLQKPRSEGEVIFIDSSSIRAHQHAAGAQKKTEDKPLRHWDEAEVGFRRKSTSVVSPKPMRSLSSGPRGKGMMRKDLQRYLRVCHRIGSS